MVTISIDPQDTFDLARKKKETYLDAYGRPAPGWHFLTDYHGNAKRLAEEIGFHYRYDAKQQQFAHTSADHDADAGRQAGAVSLRHPLPLAGSAFRADGGVRRPRHRRPSTKFCCGAITTIRTANAYVLFASERDEGRRSLDGADHGIFPVAPVPGEKLRAEHLRGGSGKDGIRPKE